jgi:hypothetical protein
MGPNADDPVWKAILKVVGRIAFASEIFESVEVALVERDVWRKELKRLEVIKSPCRYCKAVSGEPCRGQYNRHTISTHTIRRSDARKLK